jgi:ATP-dependent DNA helicase RecQ
LSAIDESDEGLSVVELMARMNVRRGKLEQALKFVMSENPSPVVKVKSKYVATPFLSQYELPAENIQRLTDIRHQELERMDEYVRTGDCLMNFLCSELDSPADEPSCQRCGNCRPQEALPTGCDTSLAQKAAEFLNKSDLPITPRRQWADAATAATAFGIEAKKNIPAALTMEEGRALSVYGAGGLGRLVPWGKYRTTPPRFDDRLVAASAELLARWRPEKRPEWVTCIPSRRTPTLVPDFARRLAAKLGLPFVECLCKVKDTPPQKEMENSSFQQNNLIGTFEVSDTPPNGVCLLVDDMVDSKWTFTIAAAILLKAGASAVVPFALADSSGGD